VSPNNTYPWTPEWKCHFSVTKMLGQAVAMVKQQNEWEKPEQIFFL
jgi:hypothetical protein